MNKRKGFLLGLGSMAAVLAIGGAALVSGVGVTRQSEALYMTDGPDYQDVHDLTKASGAVAHVRILSAGKSYLVPFDAPVTNVAPARKDDSAKGKLGQQTSGTPAMGLLQNGILQTDYTAEVLDNVRGASVKFEDRGTKMTTTLDLDTSAGQVSGTMEGNDTNAGRTLDGHFNVRQHQRVRPRFSSA